MGIEEIARAAGKSMAVPALTWCVFGSIRYEPSVAAICVSVLLLLSSAWVADLMPMLGNPAPSKTYPTFKSFWPRYLAEHREPRDRVAHVFEFFGVLAFMALSPGRLVTFCLTLGFGSLLTRPLLHICTPKVESQLMYVIGGILSQICGVPMSFAVGYAVWLAFDFVGHAFLGENASAAAFLGKHYLAWALVGQAHFACKVAANFPQELFAARKCVAARAASAT